MPTIPEKLKAGGTVRIIAPSQSLRIIAQDCRDIATDRLEAMGLRVTFGAHAEEMDNTGSPSIESRVQDLHEAFRDPEVMGVFVVIGGFNVNQLLRYIDWEIIRKNPKVFIGFSDTTALQNAMLAKAGLVTYSGPSYSTLGQKLYFDYTLDYFKKCLINDASYTIQPSPTWSDEKWYLDQEHRTLINNEGWWPIKEGEEKGTLIGGNLCTLNLLQGTEYFPDLSGAILFLEDDEETDDKHFDRDFESLMSTPQAHTVRGIVFGRFQQTSGMDRKKIERLIAIRPYLTHIPIAANADFGHTSPIFTFPIGGEVKLAVRKSGAQCTIIRH